MRYLEYHLGKGRDPNSCEYGKDMDVDTIGDKARN